MRRHPIWHEHICGMACSARLNEGKEEQIVHNVAEGCIHYSEEGGFLFLTAGEVAVLIIQDSDSEMATKDDSVS